MSEITAPPSTPQPAAAQPRPGAARVVLRTVRDFLVRSFVEPVREGRLRDIEWPRGLRPIVTVALLAEATGIVLIILAVPFRSVFDLMTQGGSDPVLFPRALLWLIAAIAGIALSLTAAGALHAPAWLRWLLTSFIALVLLILSTNDTTTAQTGRITAIVAALALLLVTAICGRRGRGFVWWEFLLVTVLVWGSVIVTIGTVSASARGFGVDAATLTVGLLISMLGQFAIPVAIASGSAVAELAVSTASWAVTAVRDNLGRGALIVALLAALAWRVIDLTRVSIDAAAEPVVLIEDAAWSIGFLGAVVLAWALLARIRARAAPPTLTGLLEGMGGITIPIAAISVFTILVFSVAQMLQLVLFAAGVPEDALARLTVLSNLLSTYTAFDAVRIAVGALLLVLAAVRARQGRTSQPELLAAIGVSFATFGIANQLGMGLERVANALSVVGTIAAVALLVVLLIRRSLTLTRLVAVTAALLISALFANRDWISDPLAAIFGAGAIAVVFIGLVWGQLTGYSTANEDSPRYPRPTRVLLTLANSVFAVGMIAYTALALDSTAGLDLGGLGWVGAIGFGNALIAGALFVTLRAAVVDGPLDEDRSDRNDSDARERIDA